MVKSTKIKGYDLPFFFLAKARLYRDKVMALDMGIEEFERWLKEN